MLWLFWKSVLYRQSHKRFHLAHISKTCKKKVDNEISSSVSSVYLLYKNTESLRSVRTNSIPVSRLSLSERYTAGKTYVDDILDCIFACLQQSLCVSIVANSGGKFWCELLPSTRYHSPQKLTSDSQTRHFYIQVCKLNSWWWQLSLFPLICKF